MGTVQRDGSMRSTVQRGSGVRGRGVQYSAASGGGGTVQRSGGVRGQMGTVQRGSSGARGRTGTGQCGVVSFNF